MLDPFFGSGTVGVVCEALDRKYIGVELHPEYIALAIKRLEVEGDKVIKVAMGL